ncbi:MAG: PQQ-dependent sugar dehydrogenase, partial [Anaerolineae bacterium]|nr:PQQ-dependent sugar dehydrogenase [Caldilineales bacterium]MDW8269496.1 PQQ-dependent sugar dehydrogenase [Anaerolineae bacterium]
VEQAGRVRIIKNGILLPGTFLDIGDRVSCCGERGLLSIAFPPGFAAKQYFYVNYTDPRGDTVVARYRVLPGQPNTADPESEAIILRVEQPYANHNGGQLAFGPDGYLYIGLGDGGSAGDPHDLAQNPATWLGKLLRLDTETGTSPYAIPATNPFTATTGYRGEIWAVGLRNPWRFSFDRATGDLYVADVGQNRREEVNFQPAGSAGGENYGWRVMEGSLCYRPSSCDPTGLVLPVAEYDHSLGCSVTGGFVARAAAEPALQGIYVFGDYCSGRIWGLRRTADGAWEQALLLDTLFTISTFGEDEAGHLYLADYGRGHVYRLGASHSLWLPLLQR